MTKYTHIQKRIILELQNHMYNSKDFLAAHLFIENMLYDAKISNGTILELKSPYKKDFSLKVIMTDKGLDIRVANKDIVLHTLDHDHTKTHRNRCEELISFLKKERITFAPLPGQDFISAIYKAAPGTIINLNNTISLACIKHENNITYFKKQFEGSLKDITINSFTNSEYFAIDNKNLEDIHYLFGRIYSTRVSNFPIRVAPFKENEAKYFREKVENSLPESSSRSVLFGPLKLLLIKTVDNECAWYDATGTKVNTELVDVIFAWAKNIIPEINKKEWLSLNPADGLKEVHSIDYDEWLQEAKYLLHVNDKERFLDSVFTLAKTTSNTMSITIDDLDEDLDGNFISTTYAFKNTESGRYIYKLFYENNDRNLWVTKVEPVSEKEFTDFCEYRFTSSIKQIELTNNHLSNGDIEKKIREFIKDPSCNPFGFTKEKMNNISAKTAILLNKLEDIENEEALDDFLHL